MEFRPRRQHAEALAAPLTTTATQQPRTIDFEAVAKYEDAKWAARADSQYSGDESARETMKRILATERQRDALGRSIRELRQKIDQAVDQHAARTAPLQAELASEDISAQDRIEARMEVDDANALLESTIAPLKKALSAGELEYELMSVRLGGKVSLENAFVNAGPDGERLRVLSKCAELLQHGVLFSAQRAAENAQHALEFEQRRLKQMATMWDQTAETVVRDQQRRHAYAVPDVEKAASFRSAVSSLLAGFARQIADEAAAIRAKRLAELYR